MEIIEDGITCGMEIETDFLFPDLFFKKAPKEVQAHFIPTHDASCESDAKIFNNNLLLKNSLEKIKTKEIVLGVELVSEIFNSDEEKFLMVLKKLTNFLLEIGEPLVSERSGIHFHISLSNPPLKVIKNILILGAHYEKLFFHLGGMGYPFRGEKNDSVYCRPITKKGPPCVKTPQGWAQIFNLEEVKNSKNQSDFWINFADSFSNATNRYTPARYVWLNILGLFPRGSRRKTVEFRIFNKSLNPHYIFAVFLACKKLVHLAIEKSYKEGVLDSLKENSIYDEGNVFIMLEEFLNEINLEAKWARVLFKILERTPEIELKNNYIKSHLYERADFIFWDEYNMGDKIIIPEHFINFPKFIDIHTLRG